MEDPRLKKICDIEADEPPYGIAVLSRFRSKVGPERLARIVDQAVEVLVAKGRIKGEALALDSTFIKAKACHMFTPIFNSCISANQHYASQSTNRVTY